MRAYQIPIGAMIQLGTRRFGRHDGYEKYRWVKVDETKYILCAEDVNCGRAFDECEARSPSRARRTGGNNLYPVSNIHQWLNAESPILTPLHDFDCAFTGYYPGTLSIFSADEMEVLETLKESYRIPSGSKKDLGDKEIEITAKVMLPDKSLFEHNHPGFRPKAFEQLYKTYGKKIWTRTGGGSPSRVVIAQAGHLGSDHAEFTEETARNTHYIMPIIQIKDDTEVYPDGDMYSISPVDVYPLDDLSILFD